jgi:hypothetical protein
MHMFMQTNSNLRDYTPGGLDVTPTNILRLISELEGSSQLLKYMGFFEDQETIDKLKKKYYTMYFKEKKKVKGH